MRNPRVEQNKSIAVMTDSYKISHWPLLPEGTDFAEAYLESRGGEFPETVFLPLLNVMIEKYLMTRITKAHVDYAAERWDAHFGGKRVFNYDGWMRIVNECDGKLPLRIEALPEGTVIPTRNILLKLRNTKKGFAWLVEHLETLVMKVWYPITVATLSREIKKVIYEGLVRTGTPESIDYKLHGFGYRGVSSEESAGLGDAAHLVNFLGTDTFAAIELLYEFYDVEMAGFSIPATEHFVMSAKGPLGEVEQMKKFLEVFGNKGFPFIACVSDTYDIWNACENLWGAELKQMVENLDGFLVIRPDSGDPATICVQIIEILGRRFGYVTNDKGFKVLNHVRIIQGDGLDNVDSFKKIINALEVRGWSIDNISFGMGGGLIQKVNRDTLKFALKGCSLEVNGMIRDIWKDPKSDSSGKPSKAGQLKPIFENGEWNTVRVTDIGKNLLRVAYEDGENFSDTDWNEIRERAKI